MKPDIRWQLLLALAGFGLVLSLLSFQVQTADYFCTVTEVAPGGTFVEGVVGAPQYLNPLLSDPNPVDRDIVSLLFDGLIRYEEGTLVPALAERWEVDETGRVVRFVLRDDAVWHDGEPVTTADVAFTYGLLQEEAFPGDAALKRLWQSVIIRPVSETVIEFELTEPYAAFLEATTRGILPAHRLEDVTAASLAEVEFNREPVGTGPFIVEPDQDWQQSGQLLLTPAPEHWSEDIQLDHLAFRFFPDEESLLDAFAAGDIQAINSVSPVALPEVAEMPHARLFTAPAPRYTSLFFNVSETGSAATRSVDVRRALAYGLDRAELVDDTLQGQGVPLAGPYLPTSWAYNPGAVTLYGSEPISATVGLEQAGWLLPEGSATRELEGEPLLLRFLVHDTPTNRAVAEEIAAQWTEVGAAPQLLLFSEWSEFRQRLVAREFDVALVNVLPPNDPDLYDFWSQEAIVRGHNFAGWNRRRASEALEGGRQVWSVAERRPFYDTFLRLYNEDLPELTLFQHVYTYAVTSAVNNVEIGRITEPRDRYVSLPEWTMLYRDVTVACPTATPEGG